MIRSTSACHYGGDFSKAAIRVRWEIADDEHFRKLSGKARHLRCSNWDIPLKLKELNRLVGASSDSTQATKPARSIELARHLLTTPSLPTPSLPKPIEAAD